MVEGEHCVVPASYSSPHQSQGIVVNIVKLSAHALCTQTPFPPLKSYQRLVADIVAHARIFISLLHLLHLPQACCACCYHACGPGPHVGTVWLR
jgi:hypothetical protein